MKVVRRVCMGGVVLSLSMIMILPGPSEAAPDELELISGGQCFSNSFCNFTAADCALWNVFNTTQCPSEPCSFCSNGSFFVRGCQGGGGDEECCRYTGTVDCGDLMVGECDSLDNCLHATEGGSCSDGKVCENLTCPCP